MSEDPFRWCIYCLTDCYADEPAHLPDCPSSTGVYPAEPGDCCCDCNEPLDGMYVAQPLDEAGFVDPRRQD